MTHLYENIQYTLIRNHRKTLCIQINPEGKVLLRVPQRTRMRQVESFIEHKKAWILRHVSARRARSATKNGRQYVDGVSFLYLGKSYRLKIVKNQNTPLVLKAGSFCLRSDHAAIPGADDAFKTFYRERGLKRIGERVACFQARMGVEIKRIRMVEAKTRWASCSRPGNLNFHWKCLMLPRSVLDYIVVHELAHLIQMNHSKLFWREVEKIIPDYHERRNWLRRYGAEIGL